MAEEQRLSAVIELKDNMSANINKMSTNFAQFIKRTSALDPILQKTDTATKRTGRAFDELGVKVGKTKSSLNGLRRVYNTSLRVKDYATSTIRKVKAEATAFGGKVYTATMAMRDATGPAIGKVKNKLSGAAAGLTMGVPVQMLGMAGIGLGAMDIIKTYSDFTKEMSNVKAISGASEEAFEKLTKSALEMGRTSKFTATESAQALGYMAMAGWNTEQMMSGLPGVMNLAAASGEDLAKVSDIVTDAMTAFKMPAADSAHFADVLAKASSKSNTNVGLMGYTFKYVAPLAGTLGYSIEDVGVAIGAMANVSIKGEQAGTNLRAILSRMSKPTEEISAAMADIGVSLTDANGQMKPFSSVMKELRTGFKRLTPEQRLMYASTIAGTEAMSGLLAIVEQGDDDFAKLTKEINNAKGASQEMAAVKMNNLAGDLTLLSSEWDSFVLGLMTDKGGGGGLRSAVQEVTDVIKAFHGVDEQGRTTIEVWKGLGKIIGDTLKKVYEFDGSAGAILATGATITALYKIGKVGTKAFKWLKSVPKGKQLPVGGSSGLPGISDMTVNAATVYVNGSVVPGTDSGVSPGGKKSPGKTSVPREAPVPTKPRSRWRIGVDATKKVGGYALKPVKAVAKRIGWLPVITGAYQIATAQPGQRMQATANVAGGLAGAWAGGKAGAAIGGAVGSAFGGVGAIPGAAIGGVLGSIGGYMGGEALMENWSSVTDWISNKTKEAGDRAVENYRQSQLELSSITEETNSKEAQMVDLRAQAWKGAWESVKSVWGECQGWFDANVWQPLVSAVNSAKESIISAFSDAVAGAKAVWQGITGWFEENIIGPLRSKFNTLSTLASGISMPSEIGGSGGSLLEGTYSFFSSGTPKRNALGTTYFTGGLTTINEHGEELIDLAGGSRIYPAGQTKRIIQDEVRSSVIKSPETSDLVTQDVRAFTPIHLSDDAPRHIEAVKPLLQPEQIPVLQVPGGPAQRSKGDVKLFISGNTFIIREKADIDEVVYKLYRLIAEGAGNFGGEVSV